MIDSNLYYAAATAQIRAGEDGEDIVRKLVEAFVAIAGMEVGFNKSALIAEFTRLLPQPPKAKEYAV